MMTRYESLFGTLEKGLETILSIKCLNVDDFEGCEGCKFFGLDNMVDGCPQYPNGAKSGGVSLREWLEVEE